MSDAGNALATEADVALQVRILRHLKPPRTTYAPCATSSRLKPPQATPGRLAPPRATAILSNTPPALSLQVRTALLGCRWSDAASWVPLAEMMDGVRGEQRGLDEFREAVRQPCRKYEVKTRR